MFRSRNIFQIRSWCGVTISSAMVSQNLTQNAQDQNSAVAVEAEDGVASRNSNGNGDGNRNGDVNTDGEQYSEAQEEIAPEEAKEEKLVSLSHVLTDIIVLQEFLLELAALIQVRAGLFGEVRFM
jgi:hypothetical protein